MTMLSSKGCCRRKVCLSSDRKAVKPPPSPLCGKRRLKKFYESREKPGVGLRPIPWRPAGFSFLHMGFSFVGWVFNETKISPCGPGWTQTSNGPLASHPECWDYRQAVPRGVCSWMFKGFRVAHLTVLSLSKTVIVLPSAVAHAFNPSA